MKNLIMLFLIVASVVQSTLPAFAERSDANIEFMKHEQGEITRLQKQIDGLKVALQNKTEDKEASEKFGSKVFEISLPMWVESSAALGLLVLGENKGLGFKGIGRIQQAALLVSVVAGVGMTVGEGSRVKVWLDKKTIDQIEQDIVDAQNNLESRKATLELLKKSEVDQGND